MSITSVASDCLDEDEELGVDEAMFEPLYENAGITVCGAFYALMEFKRSCRLPFTAIDMLLQLLQLLCPPNNKLPQSVYKFRKFFEQYSSSHKKQQFCSKCDTEFKENESQCDHPFTEPNTLISFDPTNAMRRVLKHKLCTNKGIV